MVPPGSRFAPLSPDSARPSGLMRGSVRLLDWLDAPFGLAPSARPSGLPRPSARSSVRSSGFGLSLGPAPSARFGCGLDFGLPLGLPSKGRRASKVLEIDPVDSRFFTKCIGVSSNLEGSLLRYAFDLGFSEREKAFAESAAGSVRENAVDSIPIDVFWESGRRNRCTRSPSGEKLLPRTRSGHRPSGPEARSPASAAACYSPFTSKLRLNPSAKPLGASSTPFPSRAPSYARFMARSLSAMGFFS